MKTIYVFVMFVLLGGFAYAQEARVVAELSASAERLVKNAPFAADAVSESTQTLADGNRIVRNSTSKLYRNSEGRFRREFTGGSGGLLGSAYSLGPGVTIMDPVGGFQYMIDPNMRTTRQTSLIAPRSDIRVIQGLDDKVRAELKAAGAAGGSRTIVETGQLSEKIRGEVEAAVAVAPVVAARAATTAVMAERISGMAAGFGVGQHQKWDTRTEELGAQNIEGVEAEGTRTITTIPAGAIGNERPIEITYEKWYSRELQLVVMSKHSDPRFGEQSYRLTNIVRSEPDPSLFTPPQGYKLVTEPRGQFTFTNGERRPAVDRVRPAAQAASPKARP